MKKIFTALIVLLVLSNLAFMPWFYSLEDLLVRAKFVFVAKVVSFENGKVTLAVTEKLRGESEKEKFVFDFEGGEKPSKDELYFVFSQGHDQFGKPKNIIQIGQPFRYPLAYCGWVMFLVKKEKNVEVVKDAFSGKFTKSDEEIGPLTIEQAKSLIKEGEFKEENKEKASEKEYPLSDDIPMGRFGYRLGKFLIIEGVRVDGKGVNTFLVDTVNGKKLDKPISTWVEGKVSLPKGKRCVIRGYESGRMIGIPNEVADKEGLSHHQAAWEFHRYFVVTSIKEGEDPAFIEQDTRSIYSRYGSATISVKKTELLESERFIVDVVLKNEEKDRDYYNPFLKRDLPLPAKLVLFNSEKKFVKNLYWHAETWEKVFKESDWQNIPSKSSISTEIGTFQIKEPGEYYLQLIYRHALIGEPSATKMKPLDPYNPNAVYYGPYNENVKKNYEKAFTEFNKEELFRSNALKIKVSRKVVE